MPTASASDVRQEYDTYLSDTEIEGDSTDSDDDGILGRIERDINREMTDPPDENTDDRKDLEAVLAALFIAETRDRPGRRVQSGRSSVGYEADLIPSLRSRARTLGVPESLLEFGGKNYSNFEVF